MQELREYANYAGWLGLVVGAFLFWWFGIRRAIDSFYQFGKRVDYLSQIADKFSSNSLPIWDRVEKIEEAICSINSKRWAFADIGKISAIETDDDSNVIWVSRPWTEMTGMSIEDCKGRGWLSCVHPEDFERVSDEWKSCTTDRRKFRSFFRIKSAGRIQTIELSAAPAFYEGQFRGYVGIAEQRKTASV